MQLIKNQMMDLIHDVENPEKVTGKRKNEDFPKLKKKKKTKLKKNLFLSELS